MRKRNKSGLSHRTTYQDIWKWNKKSVGSHNKWRDKLKDCYVLKFNIIHIVKRLSKRRILYTKYNNFEKIKNKILKG